MRVLVLYNFYAYWACYFYEGFGFVLFYEYRGVYVALCGFLCYCFMLFL